MTNNSQLQTLLGTMSGDQLKQLVKDLGIKVPEEEKAPRRSQSPQTSHGTCKRPATVNLTVNCFCGARFTTVKETTEFTPLYNNKADGSIRVTPVKPGSAVFVETWTKTCSSCKARIALMSREELEARYLMLAEACLFGGKPWIT